MKNIKSKYLILPNQLCLLLLTLILSMSITDAVGQEKEKKKKKKSIPLELKVGLEFTYDDNILKYSDKYLERFLNGEDEGRFHIETYDDIIVNPSIEGVYTMKIFKKLKSRINASFSPRFYMVNTIKNWSYYGIGFQQYLSKRAFIKLLYSYIPDFYVRHFRDDAWVNVYGYTPETFQPYAFSKDSYGAYIQNTFFKNTRIKLSLYHARYYHNEHFTEYDSKDWLYGFSIYQPIYKNFRLTAGYEYVTSDAKGYDAAYQTPENTTGPDATFAEDRFDVGFDWRLPKIRKRNNNLEVDMEILNRYYSTSYGPLVDPLHSGRVDANYRIYTTYNLDLTKSLELTAYYNWLLRDSHTKAEVNSEYVSDEKDYRQNQIGIELKYNFKL